MVLCLLLTYHYFSHKLCLVGFRNSGCEHKGSHSREIPDPPGPWTDPCSIRACPPFFLDKFLKQIVFFVTSYEKWHFWDIFYLEGRVLGHVLEWCRTRRKRLYILQEINPRWLQIKTNHEQLGLRSTTWGKSPFFIVKVQFLKKYERNRINARAFSTLRIGLRCHMRSTFEETVFQQKNGFQTTRRRWRVILDVSKKPKKKWHVWFVWRAILGVS